LILGIDFLCLESINYTLQNVRAEFSIVIPAECRWQNVDLLLTHLFLMRLINYLKRTLPLWLPVLLFVGRNPKDLQGRLTDRHGPLDGQIPTHEVLLQIVSGSSVRVRFFQIRSIRCLNVPSAQRC
jgi:hypothetical protein